MTTELSYAAVVIAYRDVALAQRVIDQLATQTIAPSLILVVDNGGTFGTDSLDARNLDSGIVLVSRPDNPGYSAAVNEARRTSSDTVLVLTHDAVFGPELAATLIGALESRPDAGAVAPVLHWVSVPNRVFSAGGFLTRGGRATHLVKVRDSEPYAVDWVDGAVVLYRRSALQVIDWLDEQYFLYFEDVDTAWRMSRAGLATLIDPNAKARQEPGSHPMRLGIRNMTLFARQAQIPLLLHVGAVARRVGEHAAAEILRRRPPGLLDAWRGWRDGRRGIGGPPSPEPGAGAARRSRSSAVE